MKNSKPILSLILVLTSMMFFASCELNSLMQLNSSQDDVSTAKYGKGGGGGGGGEESTVGSNLSFPVIWAEGTTLTLRTPPVGVTVDGVSLDGEWWYVWGVDPADPSFPIYSCLPVTGEDPCYPAGEEVYKAWVQKDAKNFWQASAVNAIGPANIDVIDWGDNLESVDWYLTSKVRTEVGLYKNAPEGEPFRQYAMRHVFGWGTDELHGLQTTLTDEIVYGPGTEATVYSEHARLTIQKITSDTPSLTWDAENSKWIGDVLDPVFSRPVWEEGDGPGYYNAEVNIKGKIIYGYTWDVKQANDGVGVYRITFSFDEEGPITSLNTFFTDATIIEGAEIIPAAEDEGGSKAVVDTANNLTYIDVVILGNKGGGKGGKGK